MYEWPYGDPAKAPARAPLHVGGALDFPTLLSAYRHGVFPWYSEDEPVQWFSPNPRFVLLPDELRVTDSLRKTLRKPGWRVTVDQDFEGVMRRCAAIPRPGQDGTWITEDMIAAYVELHRKGFAHSVEVTWQGELVGGLYGVSIGRIFHGESMFHTRSDASKVGFVSLVARLKASGYVLIDCQMPTPHLAS
ncbi:MAG: leucyl/phenylalanyl-tRNA/protein transferase, partial [Verrucomicrobiota bacterium]